MPNPQSFESHTSSDLIYLALVATVLFDFTAAIFYTIHGWPHQRHLHAGWIVTATALILIVLRLRNYALRVQDRVIRLEERHRIAALVPLAELDRLSTRQLIALRFASDAELPALVSRTLGEDLEPKAIKQAIVSWRSDHARI